MKKKLIISLLCLLTVQLFFRSTTYGQIKQIGDFLSTGTDDASTILQEYLKPYANSFGADLSSGWYNTAKVHKLGGFDITFSINASIVPAADKSFDITKIGLKGTYNVTGSGITPTVAGKNDPGPQVELRDQTNAYTLTKFTMPKGTGVGILPAPMLQLGIGLVKETEVVIRWVPTMNFGSSSLGLWGIGLKHSIKQWIPGIKMAPFFNLSFFGGYTSFKSNVDLSLTPAFYNGLSPAPQDNTVKSKNGDNQNLEMKVKSFTMNIVASFDLPVVTLYGGVGFCSTTTSLALNGYYPVPALSGTNVVISDSKTDPFMNIKFSGNGTKPRLNAGIKFKMAIITLHFDYTLAKYSVATAGLGISFR
jgi:hypothetical protein